MRDRRPGRDKVIDYAAAVPGSVTGTAVAYRRAAARMVRPGELTERSAMRIPRKLYVAALKEAVSQGESFSHLCRCAITAHLERLGWTQEMIERCASRLGRHSRVGPGAL